MIQFDNESDYESIKKMFKSDDKISLLKFNEEILKPWKWNNNDFHDYSYVIGFEIYEDDISKPLPSFIYKIPLYINEIRKIYPDIEIHSPKYHLGLEHS